MKSQSREGSEADERRRRYTTDDEDDDPTRKTDDPSRKTDDPARITGDQDALKPFYHKNIYSQMRITALVGFMRRVAADTMLL